MVGERAVDHGEPRAARPMLQHPSFAPFGPAKVADMRRPANNKTEDEVARAMRVAQPGEIHRQRTL